MREIKKETIINCVTWLRVLIYDISADNYKHSQYPAKLRNLRGLVPHEKRHFRTITLTSDKFNLYL